MEEWRQAGLSEHQIERKLAQQERHNDYYEECEVVHWHDYHDLQCTYSLLLIKERLVFNLLLLFLF